MILNKLNFLRQFHRIAPGFDGLQTPVNAAILHLDIVGSTELVKRDLEFAHHQVGQLYRRICGICSHNRGFARELRGDAVVAEFERADDALKAAIAIQALGKLVSPRFGRINPQLRIGISYGEVVSEANLITGLAVIRAQRLEQLAESGQIMVDELFRSQLTSENYQLGFAGIRKLKGFDGVTKTYRVRLESGRSSARFSGTFFEDVSSCST